jgi:hypothetical protein
MRINNLFQILRERLPQNDDPYAKKLTKELILAQAIDLIKGID